jgi:hypothetical protein
MRADQGTEPLTVGQLAARATVRTDTIRYYEREGLLPTPRRTSCPQGPVRCDGPPRAPYVRAGCLTESGKPGYPGNPEVMQVEGADLGALNRLLANAGRDDLT